MTTTTTAPPPPPPAGELGKCLVCGDAIQQGNLVGCTKCDTPHHRDCFEYNGHCAVYACGSTTYSVKWRKGKPAVMRAGKGPAEAERPEPPRPQPPRRERRQEALGEEEIRIESYGALRSLGIGCATAAGTVFAGCSGGTSADAACSGGCDLPAGGGDLEGLLILIAVVLVIFVVWKFVVPAILSAIGWILYWFDNSYWTVDERDRLVLRTRFFGIPVWTRRWPAARAEEVCVGPVRGAQVQWLVVRFLGGGQVFLADDRRHERMGYDHQDLVRMGRRLAGALRCSFRTVGEQAERPYEPHAE